MFNFFKKSKSKDNSSSKSNSVPRNVKEKQTGASAFLTGSIKKNSTKSSQQERVSNNERDVSKDLNLSKNTESVGIIKDEIEVMGNTESKSESTSPAQNKIGGNEQSKSLERSIPQTVDLAREEFFHLDKNSNGVVEKAECSPSTSTSSPTVSDLLRGINSLESASNERKKKESTPDSDVVFKTAPNTPVLSRDNCPRQITVPAELPSIFELPSIERDVKLGGSFEKLQENMNEKKPDKGMNTTVTSSGNEDNRILNHEIPVENIGKCASGNERNNNNLNQNGKPSDKDQDSLKINKCIDHSKTSIANVKAIDESSSSSNSNSNITECIDNPKTSITHGETVGDSERDCSKQLSGEQFDNVNIPANQVVNSHKITSTKNTNCNLESVTAIETDTSLLNHDYSQDRNNGIMNEHPQRSESGTSCSVNDVQQESLTNDEHSGSSSRGEESSLEPDSISSCCIDEKSDENLGSDLSLPNCDELLEMLSTDFPDNSKSVSECDTEKDICEVGGESGTMCLNGVKSLQNVTGVEALNSASRNCDNSMNNSCSDSTNDIEVSVCILMRKNGTAEVEEKLSQKENESIEADGFTDSAFSEGNQTNDEEKTKSESFVEKICEVEYLCPVEKLAGNNNGCLVGEGESTTETKADLQRKDIENLPEVIIESVEEQDSRIVRLEENETEGNCGKIYEDESSSDEEDDSEEPLTVMERADFIPDNEKKSDDSGEEQHGESMSEIHCEAASVNAAAQFQEEMLDRTKEHLVNAEKRADKQMAELKSELEDSEKEMFRMKIQVQDLQRESIAKTGGMERLQAELSAAYKDSEFVRRKLKRLEEELANFKQKNSDLAEELSKKAEIENENDYWKVMELENEAKELTRRVKELEAQLSTTRAERDGLKKRVEELIAESDEERKLAQEALDETMAEKLAMQEKYEREFEKLRSANIDREQKMLDDFEWKLREVEQACKKRLDDKEQSSRQLVREVEGKLTVAEGKLAQLPHLKQCEQELNHLRERSIEQQRSLRTATRQLEQLQDSDKQQHEEIQQLKQLLEKEKSHLTTVQSIHYRELAEKERKLQFKLDQQKTEINSEWEDKMRRETQRIKTETDRHHRTEKIQALDEAKRQHQQKLKELESSWEKKHIACVKEIDSLKTKLSEKEDYYKQEFETIQTKADRDIFDLRRKLDKIDLSYQEQIEKMQQKHEKELEKLREEADRRIQQCELNAQHQVGASRTTIELVKEQMQRESQEKLQQLSEHHRRQLEEQWEQLVQERDDAIAMIEQKHRSSMEKLRNELDSIYKGRNSRETELLDTLNHMRQELSGKTTQIGSLETNVEELQGNLEVLNCEVNNKAQQISKVMQEGEEVLRQRERQLQETFHSQLEEMNQRHRKEISTWQNNVDELQKKIASLAKCDENKDTSSAEKKIEELVKQLKEKEQQIATLSKEKHLYQLELMNKDKESVQAKQRRKGGRGRHQGGRGQRC